jgi:hypothetical protein
MFSNDFSTGLEGVGRKNLQKMDSTQLNIDLSNAHIKSVISLFQE